VKAHALRQTGGFPGFLGFADANVCLFRSVPVRLRLCN